MKLNIGKKYALFFGIISLVVSAGLATSFALLVLNQNDELKRGIEITERMTYEENQVRTNHNIVRYLGKYLFAPLYRLDIEAINALIKDIKITLPIRSFYVADDRGTVLTDGSAENEAFGRKLVLDVERIKKEGMAVKPVPDGTTISFPITAGGHVAGYGEITFSDKQLKAAIDEHEKVVAGSWSKFRKEFVRVGLLGTAGVLAIAGLLSVVFSRTLSRPLLALKQAADHVARGNLQYRVTVESADEIGKLAESFNTMVMDLQTSTERLQDANRKLRELDQLKSEFISVVSHEFRTPLTSIKAFTELLMMKPSMPEHRKLQLLSNINIETDRLSKMVGDVLDLTRIESGQMAWNMNMLSIEEVIARAVTSIQPIADEKGLTMEQHIEGPLPLLAGDRDRLIQVIVNILSNAVKYTPSPGTIRISATIEPEPVQQVVVVISDTGIGIQEQYLEVIFEKFRRADQDLISTSEGAGLGLSIARQIIEAHGGKIRAESTVGRGAAFIIKLPVTRDCRIESAV